MHRTEVVMSRDISGFAIFVFQSYYFEQTNERMSKRTNEASKRTTEMDLESENTIVSLS